MVQESKELSSAIRPPYVTAQTKFHQFSTHWKHFQTPFQRFHPNAIRLLQQEPAGATRHRDLPKPPMRIPSLCIFLSLNRAK